MAKLEVYECDLCKKLTRQSYTEFDFDVFRKGKHYEGFVTLTFGDNAKWDICIECAKILILEGGPF